MEGEGGAHQKAVHFDVRPQALHNRCARSKFQANQGLQLLVGLPHAGLGVRADLNLHCQFCAALMPAKVGPSNDNMTLPSLALYQS